MVSVTQPYATAACAVLMYNERRLTDNVGVPKVCRHHQWSPALAVCHASRTKVFQEQLKALHVVVEGRGVDRSPVCVCVCACVFVCVC